MSRDWFAVYSDVLRRSKYRRLSIAGKAALFHVWMMAGGQTPEATWPSRDDLADVLDLDGIPPETIDELCTRGWLDVDGRGCVLVHDWDEHQLAASEAARRAYEADRKAQWRRKPRRTTNQEPVPADPSDRQDAPAADPPKDKEPDPADAYWTIVGKYPTDKPLGWIDDLTRTYGSMAVIRALSEAHQADPATASLLGRAQDRLRRDARTLDLKAQAETQNQITARRAAPRPVVDEAERKRVLLEMTGGAGWRGTPSLPAPSLPTGSTGQEQNKTEQDSTQQKVPDSGGHVRDMLAETPDPTVPEHLKGEKWNQPRERANQ